MRQMKKLLVLVFVALGLCILSEAESAAGELQPQDNGIETLALKGSVFDDVNEGDWFCTYVEYVLNKEIMTGKGNNLFAPAESIKRAQFATILYRLSFQPDVVYREVFSDVKAGTFYTDAVLWASQEEVAVVTGYANGQFGPSDDVTREQMAAMLYRYAKYRMYDTETVQSLDSYPDAGNVSRFAQEAMEWAVGSGIITGDGGRLNPQGASNRAVCAAMIQRFCEAYMSEEMHDVEMYGAYTMASASAGADNSGLFTVDIRGIMAEPGVSGVQVWAWCSVDKSDMYHYDAVPQSDGSYHVDGNYRLHGYHFGQYQLQIQIFLTNGIRIHAGDLTVQLNGSEAEARIQADVDAVYAQAGRDLNACYWWVVNHVRYKRLPIPLTPPAGYTSEQWYAIQAYEVGLGNCFCYAAAFYFLAKGLGYDAHYIAGQVNLAAGGYGPHGWVVINLNGASYICDPEAQDEMGGYNFYMQPINATILRYRW